MSYKDDRKEQEEKDQAWNQMKSMIELIQADGYYIRKISPYCWGISKKDVWLEMHIWPLEKKLQDQETRFIYRYETSQEMMQILNKTFNAYEA